MRKNIVVDGLLQCPIGDQRFAGVCRLRERREATREREGTGVTARVINSC